MIKGIYFKKRPWMLGVSLSELLKDLNYLKEECNQGVADRNGYLMHLKQFNGKLYKAKIYESENEEGIEAIYKMYMIIISSVPDFIQVFKINPNKIIMSYSNFNSISNEQETIMDLFIDELIRVSVVSIKHYGEENLKDINYFLSDYVNTCTYCAEGYSNEEDDFLDNLEY